MITKLIFLSALIAVNAFFAASEMALISLNDNKINKMAEKGNKKAKRLMHLLGEPSRFLATIQIGITLAGFLASAFAAESFADPLVIILLGFNLPFSETVLKVTTVIGITIILSYFTLVLGELVPKRVAMKKPEKIAFAVIGPLMILSKLTNPFVKFLTASTNFFVRILGIDPYTNEDDVTEEEIRMLIDVGEEKGAIEAHEKVMINNVFEFNNKTAEEIMTHRMELVAIPSHITFDALIELIGNERYSRIPVYEDTIDRMVGVLHVKDLMPLITEDVKTNFKLESYIRKPHFVPMQKKINEIFIDFQEMKTHIAILVDEYGGTAGIVTIQDLIEEIFGDLFDEKDDEENIEIKQIDDLTYEVRGTTSINELESYFNVNFPNAHYETLNGFLLSQIGYIPPKDEMCELRYKHLFFQTLKVTDKRIEKVIIRVER